MEIAEGLKNLQKPSSYLFISIILVFELQKPTFHSDVWDLVLA